MVISLLYHGAVGPEKDRGSSSTSCPHYNTGQGIRSIQNHDGATRHAVDTTGCVVKVILPNVLMHGGHHPKHRHHALEVIKACIHEEFHNGGAINKLPPDQTF